MSDNPPGWYRDPAEPTTQRYWDGEGWAGDSLPIDATPPEGPFVAPPARSELPLPLPGQPIPFPGQPGAGPVPPPPPGWPTPPHDPYPQPHNQYPPDAPQPRYHPAPGPPPAAPGSKLPTSATPPNWPAGLPSPYGPGGTVGNLRPHGYALAPLGSRFVARIVDIIAVLLLDAALCWYLVLQYVKETGPYWRAAFHASQSGSTAAIPTMSSRGATLGAVILTFTVVIWGVYEVLPTGRSGQTLGKRLLGIRVIGLEGATTLGARRSLRRWMPLGFATLLWQCCGIGFLIQIIDCGAASFNRPFKLALHDVYAATVVVQVPPKTHTPNMTDAGSEPQKTTNGGPR